MRETASPEWCRLKKRSGRRCRCEKTSSLTSAMLRKLTRDISIALRMVEAASTASDAARIAVPCHSSEALRSTAARTSTAPPQLDTTPITALSTVRAIRAPNSSRYGRINPSRRRNAPCCFNVLPSQASDLCPL